MAKRTHDWDALAREWLNEKRKTPVISQREFFRQRGISPSLGNRRIGARMQADWEAVQAQARQQAIEAIGNDLGAEALRFIRFGKTAIQIGVRNIFPRRADDGSEIPPPHEPATFADSLALIKEGRTLTQVGITLLTGGEPLREEKTEDTVIEFIKPVLPAAPAAETQPEGQGLEQEKKDKGEEEKKT